MNDQVSDEEYYYDHDDKKSTHRIESPNDYDGSDEYAFANLEHIIASVLICTSLEIICAHRNLVERNSVCDHPEKV